MNPACIEAIVKGRSLCKFYANRNEDISAHVRGKGVLPTRVEHRNNVGFCSMKHPGVFNIRYFERGYQPLENLNLNLKAKF